MFRRNVLPPSSSYTKFILKIEDICFLHLQGRIIGLLLYPEDRGKRFVQSVGIYIYQTALRHIPEDRYLHGHRSNNTCILQRDNFSFLNLPLSISVTAFTRSDFVRLLYSRYGRVGTKNFSTRPLRLQQRTPQNISLVSRPVSAPTVVARTDPLRQSETSYLILRSDSNVTCACKPLKLREERT
jgi:hypothetical protein